MNNLCSIYHFKYDVLFHLVESHSKTELLDKCIYWWQISKYTLDDDAIWFTRPYDQIAKEAKISLSSVNRYLSEFEKKGYIERKTKLSATQKNGKFESIKRTYIKITEKLLALLSNNMEKDKHKAQNLKSSFLKQSDTIDNVTEPCSIYKEKDHNLVNNSTVSDAVNVNNFDMNAPKDNVFSDKHVSDTPIFSIESQIGERISDRLKSYIKGMLVNVQKQYHLSFSNPDKLFAEVVFSVIQESQWQGSVDPHHRVNIIAKLLRQKQWKTPKGFYNHWDVGQLFRKKEQEQFIEHQNQKRQDSQLSRQLLSGQSLCDAEETARFEPRVFDEYRFSKIKQYEKNIEIEKLKASLKDINLNIHSEQVYLKQLENWLLQKNPSVTQALVDSVAVKIAKLYEEKQALDFLIQQQIEKAA